MSHVRMKERIAELRAKIAAMLEEAGAADTTEDAIHGRDQRGDERPEPLRRRQGRLRRIEVAKAAFSAAWSRSAGSGSSSSSRTTC
jgi:hypothetical protein